MMKEEGNNEKTSVYVNTMVYTKTTYGFQISLDVKYYRLEPYSALRYWIISDRANRMRILRKEIH